MVADRWGKILDVAPQPDDEGRPTITLDNASIRFVEATDGRGEGLGGIDLVAADRDAVLAEAAKRGILGDDDVIVACGVRFRLV